MPKAAKKAAAKKLAAKKLATKSGSQSRITGRPPQPPRRPTSTSFRKEGAPEVETLAYILQSLEDIKKELVEKKMVGHLEGPYVIYIRKIRTGRSIIFDIAGNVA